MSSLLNIKLLTVKLYAIFSLQKKIQKVILKKKNNYNKIIAPRNFWKMHDFEKLASTNKFGHQSSRNGVRLLGWITVCHNEIIVAQ